MSWFGASATLKTWPLVPTGNLLFVALSLSLTTKSPDVVKTLLSGAGVNNIQSGEPSYGAGFCCIVWL